MYYRKLLFILWLALMGSGVLFGQSSETGPEAAGGEVQQKAAGDAEGASGQAKNAEDMALKKRQYRLMVGLLGLVLGGFFLFLLLFTIIRSYRRICKSRGIGRKNKPTIYVDAWSRYTLPDERDFGPESGDDESKPDTT